MYILSIITLSIMLLYSNSLVNLYFTNTTILKPTPTTPDAAIYRLEQGDIVEVEIIPKQPTEDLVLYIRAYSLRLNPGSEFDPVLIRYIPIAGPKTMNQSLNYTIEVKRAGNYAVEIYNRGLETYEVEVRFTPLKLETWTNRIRFLLSVPLAIISFLFLAQFIEREEDI